MIQPTSIGEPSERSGSLSDHATAGSSFCAISHGLSLKRTKMISR